MGLERRAKLYYLILDIKLKMKEDDLRTAQKSSSSFSITSIRF
jgi:hypothetical protein